MSSTPVPFIMDEDIVNWNMHSRLPDLISFPSTTIESHIPTNESTVCQQANEVNLSTTPAEQQPGVQFVNVNSGSGDSNPNNNPLYCGDTNCPWPFCNVHANQHSSNNQDEQNPNHLVGRMQSLSKLYKSLLKTHSQTCAQLTEAQIELQSAQSRIKHLKHTMKDLNSKNSSLSLEKNFLCGELHNLKESFERTISQFNMGLNDIREQSLQLFPIPIGNNDDILTRNNLKNSLMTVYSEISKYVDPKLQGQFESASKSICLIQASLDSEIKKREMNQQPKPEGNQDHRIQFVVREEADGMDAEWCLRLEPVTTDFEIGSNDLEDDPTDNEWPTIINVARSSTNPNPNSTPVVNSPDSNTSIIYPGESLSNPTYSSFNEISSPTSTGWSPSSSNNGPSFLSPPKSKHAWDASKSGNGFAWCTCGRKFKTKGFLMRHINRQKIPASYICGSCNMKYMRLHWLKRHMEEVHKISLPE